MSTTGRSGVFASPGLWLATAAGFSGLSTYAYLALVARAVGSADYAEFSWFWSLTVIAGLGVYLPIEQEISRLTVQVSDAERSRFSLPWFGVAIGVATALAGAILLLTFGRVLVDRSGVGWALALGLVLSWLGYSFQSPAKGRLSGSGALGRYAGVVTIEALVRVAFGIVLLTAFPGDVFLACLAVAIGSAGSLIALAGLPTGRAGGSAGGRRRFTVGTAGLIGSGLVSQLLLNCPPLLAAALAPSESVFAGALLVGVTLCRVPVFVYQAVQALFLPRLARLWSDRDAQAFRSGATRLVAGASVVAVMWGTFISLSGPVLARLIFGSDFAMGSELFVALAVGIGLLLVALAISDILLTTGGRSFVVLTWLVALVSAAAAFGLASRPIAASVLPVIAGSSAAILVGGTLLWHRVRRHMVA